MSHQHSADFGPPLTHDHEGGDSHQHDHADAGLGLSRTPRPWPDDAYPTAEQLAAWLTTCTPEERLTWADKAVTGAGIADRCIIERHEERLVNEVHPSLYLARLRAAYLVGYGHADNGHSEFLDKLEALGVNIEVPNDEADALEAFLLGGDR
jgi:hypothetical protein